MVVRWGIIGVGKISNDFCASLIANGSTIAAVGARDIKRAQAFGETFKASRAYETYAEVVKDPEVDVIYVGTIHTMHASHVRLALEAGKHVLCEKPLGLNEAEVTAMVSMARQKKLLLLEGVWTRFFPVLRKIRDVLGSGEVGEPRYMTGDFGFVAPTDPNHRLWHLDQAGGAMLDIGVYLVQAAVMVFGTSAPSKIQCTGKVLDAGMDSEGSLLLTWAEKGTASLFCTLTVNTPEELLIVCTGGHIRVAGPAHCPQQLTVSKEQGRGKFSSETFNFDLPKCPEGLSLNFPNSEGFLYQAQAVEKAIEDGLQECVEYNLDESLAVVRIMDEYRKQLGVKYPSEA